MMESLQNQSVLLFAQYVSAVGTPVAVISGNTKANQQALHCSNNDIQQIYLLHELQSLTSLRPAQFDPVCLMQPRAEHILWLMKIYDIPARNAIAVDTITSK